MADQICEKEKYIYELYNGFDVQNVKHGKWEEERLVSGENKFTCSKCGQVFQVFQGESLDFKYCPHCGAKMDGKGNNSDTV